MQAVKRHKDTAGIFFLTLAAVSVYAYWGSVMIERHTQTPSTAEVRSASAHVNL